MARLVFETENSTFSNSGGKEERMHGNKDALKGNRDVLTKIILESSGLLSTRIIP